MAEPIDLGTASALGAIQGATEFLPVSSSGHVSVGALLFGIPDAPLALSIALHAGTLLSTLLFLHGDVRRLFVETGRLAVRPRERLRTDDGRLLVGVILASIPTAIIGLALKDRVEALSHVPGAVGACLLVSAAAVWSTRRGGGKAEVPTLVQALLIGLAQGVAVLPGVSRSGSTIAVAMLLGLAPAAAFRFSFLLSLPAVGGAVLLSLRDTEQLSRLGFPVVVGGAVAFTTGLLALALTRRAVTSGHLSAFAYYLVPLGLSLLAWNLFP